MWTLTYSVDGRRRVEFIPTEFLSVVQPLAEQGREYREAVRELMAINAQLVSLFRQQQRTHESRR